MHGEKANQEAQAGITPLQKRKVKRKDSHPAAASHQLQGWIRAHCCPAPQAELQQEGRQKEHPGVREQGSNIAF